MLIICFFMLYRTRFELYAGKRNASDGDESSLDHETGAAADVRNLKIVLRASARHQWHAVVVNPASHRAARRERVRD